MQNKPYQQQRFQQNQSQPRYNPTDDFNPDWITKKLDRTGIQFLEKLGLFLCDKKDEKQSRPGDDAVTTAQLRNIFAEVKRIEIQLEGTSKTWDTIESDILLLQPKIAYNAARVLTKSRYSKMKELRELLNSALLKVSNKDDFKRFSNFFEAIIAYHKVYGGKD